MLKSTPYFLIAALGVPLLHDAWTASRAVAPVPYREFRRSRFGETRVELERSPEAAS